jgi:hypothetical protein
MNGSTVVILGAGASKPYGLPLGRELRDLVLKIPTHDPTTKLLKRFNISDEDFKNFKADFQTSASPDVSISNGRCILRETSFMDENW